MSRVRLELSDWIMQLPVTGELTGNEALLAAVAAPDSNEIVARRLDVADLPQGLQGPAGPKGDPGPPGESGAGNTDDGFF